MYGSSNTSLGGGGVSFHSNRWYPPPTPHEAFCSRQTLPPNRLPNVHVRPLLSDTGGGGGSNWPPGILADPPTHPHQKIFPQEKNEIYKRGPNLEVDFRYTNFFLAPDPPTPPPFRYSINQPLSKGLVHVHVIMHRALRAAKHTLNALLAFMDPAALLLAPLFDQAPCDRVTVTVTVSRQ